MAEGERVGHLGVQPLLAWLRARFPRPPSPAELEWQALGERLGEEGRAMVRNLLRLREAVVREVMVPRSEVVAVEAETPLAQAADLIVETGHSRLPVYRNDLDHVVGLLYAKDLLRCDRPLAEVRAGQVMRLPYFVPESMRAHKLLQEFRRRRIHMAVAIDEYGGTSGVVTLENLLELLVGEIQDEYDYEDERVVELADGSYLVDARADIEALEERLGVTLPRENFESAGGLLYFATGRIPQAGEEVEMAGLRFTVVSADERRILKLRVRRLPSQPPSEG